MMNTLFFRIFTVVMLFVVWSSGLNAQDMNLANQYFANGEYEKAGTLFGQLLETNPGNEFVVNRYVECMINLEKYEDGEKTIKKLIKKSPGSGNLYVQYGNLQERQGKLAEANVQYEKAIESVAPDYNSIYRLANQFTYTNKFDLAVRTYERGATLLKDKTVFSMNLGELYRRKGDSEKMIENYLNSLANNDGSRLNMVQISLARFLSPEEFGILQSQLYTRIQTDESPDLIELLLIPHCG